MHIFLKVSIEPDTAQQIKDLIYSKNKDAAKQWPIEDGEIIPIDGEAILKATGMKVENLFKTISFFL